MKLKRGILAAIAAALALLVPAGCGHKVDDTEAVISTIVQKMNHGDRITQDEYAAAIKYLEQAYKDFDKLRAHQNEGSERMVRRMMDFEEKYPHLENMRTLLGKEPEDLDAHNRMLYHEMDHVRNEVMDNGFKLLKDGALDK